MTLFEFLEAHNLPTEANSSNQILVECPECSRIKCYIDAETAVFFCQRCGLTGNFDKLQSYFVPPDPICEILEAFHEQSVRALIHDDRAIDYLDNRGFDLEAITRFRYGYANESVYRRVSKSFTEEQLAQAGLLNKDGVQMFSDHIIIPYIRAGQTVTLQGRAIGNSSIKYLFALGRKIELYHYEDLYKEGPVILTEGAFKRDRLAIEDVHASSLSGASHGKRFLDELNLCNDLYLCLDSDAPDKHGRRPGNDEALKLAKLLKKCTLMELPLNDRQKMGVDDFVDEYGIEALWKCKQVKYENGEPQKPTSLAVIVNQWREKVESHTGPLGYLTGHSRLDGWLEGFQPGTLTFIAGSPHTGKSAYSEDAAQRAYRLYPDLEIDYYSNDDGLFTTISRWVSKLGRLPLRECKKPMQSFADDCERMARYEMAVDKLAAMSDRLKILDRSYNISLERLREQLRDWRLKNPKGKKILFIDAFTKTRTERDREIKDDIALGIYKSSLLKDIAQEVEIAVSVTHEVPKLNGKRPNSWNLKGSGALEYDADVVLLTYLEAHFKGVENTALVLECNGEVAPIMELWIAKDKPCNTQKVFDLFMLSSETSGFKELRDSDYQFYRRLVYESERQG